MIPPASPTASVSPGAGIGDGARTYVSQFRQQFPWLVEGTTDRQIRSDGEADCADMAAAEKLTTPAMAKRYGLGNSTADQFTLSNIALLATFTLCGIRSGVLCGLSERLGRMFRRPHCASGSSCP